MNIDQVKALVAIATDEDRGGRERLAAFEQADDGRKTLKVGWSKLGLTVEQVTELKTELPALAALDKAETEAETEADEALDDAEADDAETEASDEPEGTEDEDEEPFEASEEELEKQTGRTSNVEAQAEADDAAALERAAKKASQAKADGAGETRGGLTRLVESLLMEANLAYLDIINAVLKEFPKANTSARSIASVAAGMRRAGKHVPMRRPVKKEKPAKAAPAPTEEQVEAAAESLEDAAEA